MSAPSAPLPAMPQRRFPAGCTRRGFLSGTVGAGLLGSLIACDATPGTAGSQGGGSWSFTDDRGEKISLDKAPKRVVAFSSVAGTLWDYGFEVIGVFGPQGGERPAPQIGDVDPDAVASVGEEYGQFNVQQLAELKPDLVITHLYDELVWYIPEDLLRQVEAIAPVAAIQLSGLMLPDALARHGDLAEALGANVRSTDAEEAKKRYDAAVADLKTVLADKPGLRAVAGAGYPNEFYVARPAAYGDLSYYHELGLNLAKADTDEDWEQLSYEEIGKYPADVILYDTRPQSKTLEQLGEIATWQELPAVRAGQTIPWRFESPYSYGRYADVIAEVAEGLRGAEKLDAA